MRPTTTGGNPKNALIKTTNSRRPRNGKIARAVPIGKLINVARAVAARLTPIETATIWKKSCKWLMAVTVLLRAAIISTQGEVSPHRRLSVLADAEDNGKKSDMAFHEQTSSVAFGTD